MKTIATHVELKLRKLDSHVSWSLLPEFSARAGLKLLTLKCLKVETTSLATQPAAAICVASLAQVAERYLR